MSQAIDAYLDYLDLRRRMLGTQLPGEDDTDAVIAAQHVPEARHNEAHALQGTTR